MKLPFEKSRKNGALLTVVAALSLGQACGDSEPKKYVGNGGAPGSGGTAATTGGSTSAGTGGAAGGTSGSSGTSGTSGASGGGSGGTVGLDAGVPVYEQDDPNLHPSDDAYQRVEIPVAVSNVMSLDIDADENVYVLERAGKLKIWKPDGTVIEAGAIDAFSGNEDGALNIALDPDFSTNGFAYIYYSSNGAPENKLSRFEIQHDMLHLESEKVLLTVPDERVVQWHVAGGLDFDSKGNLYLSTGDNTNPFESSGYAPHRRTQQPLGLRRAADVGEQPRPSWQDPPHQADERRRLRYPRRKLVQRRRRACPEIYIRWVSGNPFRIAVDRGNDWLYWGNVGPDAGPNALQTRGPLGYDEVNQAKAAGNFGWPYCIADNVPYVSYDFRFEPVRATLRLRTSLVNWSPNNSGVSNLPPAQPAWISYTYGAPPYPALGEGPRTALAGAVYRWKPGGSINKLPRYFDGSVLLAWTISRAAGSRRFVTTMTATFFQWRLSSPSLAWKEPIQMRISPKRSALRAQFGAESTVYRINYVGDNNQPPVAVVSSDVDSGAVPLTVQFSSRGAPTSRTTS